MTPGQVAAYASSDQVTPPQPHRSRIVLPLPEGDAQLNALMVHELTHLLVCEIILPGRGGRRRPAALGARRYRDLHGWCLA